MSRIFVVVDIITSTRPSRRRKVSMEELADEIVDSGDLAVLKVVTHLLSKYTIKEKV